MANDFQFGNLVKNNASKQEYQDKLKAAAEQVGSRASSGSIGAGSITEQSAGGVQGQSFNVNDTSIFNNGGVSVEDFSQMWTQSISANDLTLEQQNAFKAQNDLLSALADLDGDGMISQAEAQKLDMSGQDGVITNDDIDALYESLGVVADEATIGDLIASINDIMDDAVVNLSPHSTPYGNSFDLGNEHSLVPDKGVYYLDGQNIADNPNVQYDSETGKYSFYLDGKQYEFDKNAGTCIAQNDHSVQHDSGQSGYAVAADGTKVQWHEGQYYDENGVKINYDEETGKITPIDEAQPAERPEEIVGINMDKTGVKQADDGTFYVDVETYQGGKVFNDDGNMRYPNGSYWGIVTNAYPDVSEAEKQQIYEEISKLNGFDWQSHVLHTGERIQLPVVTRDDSGKIVFNETAANNPAGTNAADADKPATQEAAKVDEKSHAIPKDTNGKGSIHTDQGTITFEYGKYYLNGQQVDYNEKTGEVTANIKIKSTGTYGNTYTLPDGRTLIPDKGVYYLDGQRIDPDNPTFTMNGLQCTFNAATGKITFATNPQGTEVQHNGGSSGTAVAPDGTKVEWHQGKYYVNGHEVNYDESTGKITENDYSLQMHTQNKGTATAANGKTVTFEYGSYFVDGKRVDYNPSTGMYTIIQNSTAAANTSTFDPLILPDLTANTTTFQPIDYSELLTLPAGSPKFAPINNQTEYDPNDPLGLLNKYPNIRK